MKSIFHSEQTVTVDGTGYSLEADQTIEGTPFFRVSNLETGASKTCQRQRHKALVSKTRRFDEFPDEMEKALKQSEVVVVE